MEGKSDEENMKQKILGRKKMINTRKNKNCRKIERAVGGSRRKGGWKTGASLRAIEEITNNKKEQRPNYWTCYYFYFILYGLLFFCCCCLYRDMREREGDLTDPNKATNFGDRSVSPHIIHIVFYINIFHIITWLISSADPVIISH